MGNESDGPGLDRLFTLDPEVKRASTLDPEINLHTGEVTYRDVFSRPKPPARLPKPAGRTVATTDHDYDYDHHITKWRNKRIKKPLPCLLSRLVDLGW